MTPTGRAAYSQPAFQNIPVRTPEGDAIRAAFTDTAPAFEAPAEIRPSTYQQAVMDWVANDRGSAIVKARAGSGKTKLIELCLPYIPEHQGVQLLAFNSTIAKELNARIEKLRQSTGRAFANVRASTFHSLCFSTVCRKLGLKTFQVQTSSNKLRQICDAWLGADDAAMYSEFICKLVSLAKGQGIGALARDTEQPWWDLIRHHDLMLDSDDADEIRAVELARELLQRSNRAAEKGNIDFDDQLYLVVLWRLRLWQNDWVIVDESQDTNPIRRAIIKLALKPGGRMMAVGDDCQAIYGFTGASHDAMDLIRAEFSCVEFPLTVCYRCAKDVVQYAAELVSDLEAAPNAARGKVSWMPVWPKPATKTSNAVSGAMDHLTNKDAILCRSTAPLISLAFGLIAAGRPCVVLGRDIGQGLVALVTKMKARTIESLQDKLTDFLDRETAKFTARGEENKAEAVADRVSCIRVIIEELDERERTVPGLQRKIDGLFADQAAGLLTLSTIHKSKGREWPTVAILMPELMPSKWARQEWQQKQERNLEYVARTRAMEHLILLTDTGKAK